MQHLHSKFAFWPFVVKSLSTSSLEALNAIVKYKNYYLTLKIQRAVFFLLLNWLPFYPHKLN